MLGRDSWFRCFRRENQTQKGGQNDCGFEGVETLMSGRVQHLAAIKDATPPFFSPS